MRNDRMTNAPEDNPNHAGLFVIGHFESGGADLGVLAVPFGKARSGWLRSFR